MSDKKQLYEAPYTKTTSLGFSVSCSTLGTSPRLVRREDFDDLDDFEW